MKEDKDYSKYFEQVVDYMEERLSAEETEAFKAAVERSEALADAVEQYFRDEVDGGSQALEALAKDHWKEVMAQHTLEAKIVPFHLRYKWHLLAASFTGLLLLSYFLLFNSAPSKEELFAEYFTMPPIENVTVVKGNKSNTSKSENIDSLKWEATIDYYEQEDFKLALETLETIDTTSLNPDLLGDYLCLNGILLLHNEEYQLAYNILTQKETALIKQKEWYTALALLQLNRP